MAAEFSTANYGGITVTPAWPNTTDNRVQQSIDRGNNQNDPPTGNDGNWNNAAGDINLVTDFIGIDTRTGNGGNGNWDGTTGTPTYMLLTLGGLTAGAYEWTSFHHDTEHAHGAFAVWLSTDGGATFTQLPDGLMTDGTTGGTPDSTTDGSYGLVTGPDAYTLPSTYTTSFTANGTADVVMRFALYSGAISNEVHNQIWGMNGFELELVSHDHAFEPTPTDGATEVETSVVLSWSPADGTATTNGHKIFLSDNFTDVSEGLAATEMGVFSDPVFDTATLPFALEYSTTYYWRVDQASTPGGPWNPGGVWSFTTELFAYPIENITVTASSSNVGEEAENTVNGSGVDANDLHSIETTDMWRSSPDGDGPAWIEYEFDRISKLHEMWVWNHNSSLEQIYGFGFKDVSVEYSADGIDYKALGTTHEFAQAPGTPDYAHETIDFAGAAAKYVRLTANSTWGSVLSGLSEVRFFRIPVHAKEPYPDSGATDVDPDVILGWKAGREAVTHNVYVSTDPNALTLAGPVTEPAFDTASLGLELGQDYHWRVDEVNDVETTSTWQGDIWNFTTVEFLVVDDFEDYDVDKPIWEYWLDGVGFGATPNVNPGNGTGSAVGDENSPSYMEETIVHGGDKSMPFSYNNTGGAASSEAELTLTPAQDWMAHGIQTLSLWFYGDAASTPGQLYVKINGVQVLYDGDATNLTRTAWQVWNIELALFATDLQNVTTIAIGVQGNDAAGTLLFDDIRLYALARQLITPTEPDTANLVGHWMFDESSGTTAADGSGNNNHGDVMGDAQWVAGKVGGALAFDGVDDMVVVNQNSGLPIYNNGTDNAYSVAMWVKGGPQNDMRVFSEGSTTSNNPLFNMGTHNSANPTGQFAAYIRPDTGTTLNHPLSQAEPFDDTWHHITWVDDNGTATLYVDGHLDGGDFNYTRGTMALNTTTIGGILRAAPSYFFTGQIDDVHLYSRALSQAEIAWLAGVTNPFDKPF